MDQHGDRTSRAYLVCLPLALVMWIIATATLAVVRARSFLQQRGAPTFLEELAGILAIYTAGIILATKLKGEHWEPGKRKALTFGLLSAVVETISIVLENLVPQLFKHALVSISLMLITS